jgi:hypothetical protein
VLGGGRRGEGINASTGAGIMLRRVVSRPRFSCYSPARTGSAGQAPGGKVVKRQGRSNVHM